MKKEKKNVSNIIQRFILPVRSRCSSITELALDRKFSIHNGKGFDKYTINDCHLGMKFGSLCIKKNIGTYMHVYNKVKKKKKKNREC